MPQAQTVYKEIDGQIKAVHAVYSQDLQAWIDDGWSLIHPVKKQSQVVSVNDATMEDLTMLGLTVSQSKTLISNRPYGTLEDAILKVKSLQNLVKDGVTLIV